MTADCPGYDRDRRVCLLRPGDCEFTPADGESVFVIETPAAPMPDATAVRAVRHLSGAVDAPTLIG